MPVNSKKTQAFRNQSFVAECVHFELFVITRSLIELKVYTFLLMNSATKSLLVDLSALRVEPASRSQARPRLSAT